MACFGERSARLVDADALASERLAYATIHLLFPNLRAPCFDADTRTVRLQALVPGADGHVHRPTNVHSSRRRSRTSAVLMARRMFTLCV